MGSDLTVLTTDLAEFDFAQAVTGGRFTEVRNEKRPVRHFVTDCERWNEQRKVSA